MAARKTVIILNGPPGVGKDVQALAITKAMRFCRKPVKMQMKDALYAETLFHYDLGDSHVDLFIDRNYKERPNVLFGGRSPRQALQYVSEQICKPRYGKDYFGRISAQSVELCNEDFIIFSDGGFIEEVNCIAEKANTVLIRLRKDGVDFTGDTRTYLYPESIPSADFVITDGDIVGDTNKLIDLITKLEEELNV